MVDLMTANWGRGAAPYAYWNSADIDDKMAFVYSWTNSPHGHFQKFRSVGTQGVLQILRDIADHRTSLSHSVSGPWSTTPVDNALWEDTLEVIRHSPGHCGGWLGLLSINNQPGPGTSTVLRPDPSGQLNYITWPPAGGRGFLEVFQWLTAGAVTNRNTTRIQPNEANMARIGNAWSENRRLTQFIRGQWRTGGGYNNNAARSGWGSIVSSVLALVYENADEELLNFYLRGLRGHGPTEAGNYHFLNRAVSGNDSDQSATRGALEAAMNKVLQAFPVSWSRTRVADMRQVVRRHIQFWQAGTGNHRGGMEWLRERVQSSKTTFENDAILDEIFGTRTTQRTVSTSITQTLTTTAQRVETVSQSIEQANRLATTEAWTRELQRSVTEIESWSNTTGTSLGNTTGGSFGNTTSATVGGETGAIEQWLIGKLTGEVTTSVQTNLHSQFESHLNTERTTSETEQTTEAQTRRHMRQDMREQSLRRTREAVASVTRVVQQGLSIARSVQEVENTDGTRNGQRNAIVGALTDELQEIQGWLDTH